MTDGLGDPRREAILDLVLWSAVACVWVVVSLLHVQPAVGIALIGAALLGYLALTLYRRREGFADFGLRSDNLRQAALPIVAFTALGATAEVVWAKLYGRPVLQREVLLLAPIYPVWGVAQQLIIQGVVCRRLLALCRSSAVAILVAAVAFALLHVASPRLMALTFVAGLGWSWLYTRWPNVWLLGLSHGLLAALAYPLVLAESALEPSGH